MYYQEGQTSSVRQFYPSFYAQLQKTSGARKNQVIYALEYEQA
jgi:hypothetical protein